MTLHYIRAAVVLAAILTDAPAKAAGAPPAASPESGQVQEQEQEQKQEQEREQEQKPAPADPAPPAGPINYYVAPRGFGAVNESDPPRYVKPLSQYKWMGLEQIDWLDFGLEQRTRWEYRDDNYRQSDLTHDDEFLLRTRGYLGVRKILDPFRFAIEFQDSREFGSHFDETDRDVNEHDLLQAFGELFFEDALGDDQPVRLRVGRMSFDMIDRKLFARNRWRNTTNAFDGFRLQLGHRSSPWEVNLLAVQPVERRLRRFDHPDEERWLYGIVGAWRQWSRHVTLEPYYLVLDEDRKGRGTSDRQIHTLGLHAYGPIGQTAFDYDLDGAYQFGEDGDLDHCAFAGYGELGYSFKHSWKPRLSVSGTYASGDRSPGDRRSNRFDRLFGAAHFWSTTDYFTWRNMTSAKVRLELRPMDPLRLEGSYGGYWLASDSDAWPDIGRRDRIGRSGKGVGQEFELRARYKLTESAELELGYSHFIQGNFVENTGAADDSDFFYVQTTINLP